MPLSHFDRGAPPPPACTAPSCGRPATTHCVFELSGTKTGIVCGRGLCAEHGKDGVCPAHQRQIERELARGRRT